MTKKVDPLCCEYLNKNFLLKKKYQQKLKTKQQRVLFVKYKQNEKGTPACRGCAEEAAKSFSKISLAAPIGIISKLSIVVGASR